jgi:MYXO-CTERM domain-containing protein
MRRRIARFTRAAIVASLVLGPVGVATAQQPAPTTYDDDRDGGDWGWVGLLGLAGLAGLLRRPERHEYAPRTPARSS